MTTVSNCGVKLLSFGWFEWRCVEYFLKAKITVLEVKYVFWPVDWNRSGPRTNPYVKFLWICVYVDMWSDWEWSLGEGANFYFS